MSQFPTSGVVRVPDRQDERQGENLHNLRKAAIRLRGILVLDPQATTNRRTAEWLESAARRYRYGFISAVEYEHAVSIAEAVLGVKS